MYKTALLDNEHFYIHNLNLIVFICTLLDELLGGLLARAVLLLRVHVTHYSLVTIIRISIAFSTCALIKLELIKFTRKVRVFVQ